MKIKRRRQDDGWKRQRWGCVNEEGRKTIRHGWLEEAPQERATSKDVSLSARREKSIFTRGKMAEVGGFVPV